MLRRHRRERERRAGRGIRGRTHAAERAQLNMRERARYVTVRTFDNVEAFDRWWDNRKHRWKINKRQRSPDKVDEYWRYSVGYFLLKKFQKSFNFFQKIFIFLVC